MLLRHHSHQPPQGPRKGHKCSKYYSQDHNGGPLNGFAEGQIFILYDFFGPPRTYDTYDIGHFRTVSVIKKTK